MPKRNVPLVNDNYYHIYNRVIAGRKLFYTREDYVSYLTLWKTVEFSSCCRLISYCLMPNHYYYLIQVIDAHLFPKKMSYLFNCYLKSLNNSRNETGSYFKSRFKAKCIDNESYLMAVCAYIHLNPLKAGLITSLEQWSFSNCLEFLGKRSGTLWDKTFFAQHIQTPRNYESYLQTRYTEDGLELYIFKES